MLHFLVIKSMIELIPKFLVFILKALFRDQIKQLLLPELIKFKYDTQEIEVIDTEIKKQAELSELPFVVYFNCLYSEVYICENGVSAGELVRLYTELNRVLGRSNIKIIYGHVEVVFKTKIARLTDIIFTWDATTDERQQVYSLINESPMKVG